MITLALHTRSTLRTMARLALVALTALAVLVGTAARGSSGATQPREAETPSSALPRGESTHLLTFDGAARTYRVYVPDSLPRGPAPVVVVLHGGFGTGAGAARQGSWDATADARHFVEVAPDGLTRSWNAGACCGPAMRNGVDDVGFVLAVLDEVSARLDVDPDRVFATGMSNGAMFAYRIGCEASDRFAAIAPVAGTVVVPGCKPDLPVSLLHVHGLADGNVPFEGGFPTKSFQRDPPSYPPVRDGIDAFLRADGCRDAQVVVTRGSVTTERWRGCDDGTGVKLVTIADGGHSWPGGTRLAAVLDPPSDALDATSTIWRFFATHPRE